MRRRDDLRHGWPALATVPLTTALRDTIRSVEPNLPIFGVRTLAAGLDESLGQRRFLMVRLAIFAASPSASRPSAPTGCWPTWSLMAGASSRSGWRSERRPPTSSGQASASPSPGPASRPASLARSPRRGSSMRRTSTVRARAPLTFAAVALTIGLVALTASVAPALRAARIDAVGMLSEEVSGRARAQRDRGDGAPGGV